MKEREVLKANNLLAKVKHLERIIMNIEVAKSFSGLRISSSLEESYKVSIWPEEMINSNRNLLGYTNEMLHTLNGQDQDTYIYTDCPGIKEAADTFFESVLSSLKGRLVEAQKQLEEFLA
jgi:hypothetical protein